MIEEIFYTLLQDWKLPASDLRYSKLMADPDLMARLENMAAAFHCRLIIRPGILYMVPEQDNTFLGYSKAMLKAELLNSTQSDVHYYLMMFALLVLLDAFYSTDYGGGVLRDFLLLGDWMNRTEKALNQGVKHDLKSGNIPYAQMQDTYNNLLSEMDHTRKRGTKVQLFRTLLKFLEKQNLAVYLEEQSQIYLTEKMHALMDSVLRDEEQLNLLKVIESGVENAEA